MYIKSCIQRKNKLKAVKTLHPEAEQAEIVETKHSPSVGLTSELPGVQQQVHSQQHVAVPGLQVRHQQIPPWGGGVESFYSICIVGMGLSIFFLSQSNINKMVPIVLARASARK